MKAIDLIKSALRSINRNRTRSLLTMLGIIIGVGSVIGMMAIGKGSEDSIKGELGKLGTNMIIISPGGENQRGVRMDQSSMRVLKEKDIRIIKQYCPSIHYITPTITTMAQAVSGPRNCRPMIIGGYRDYFLINNYEAQYGQIFDDRTGKSLQKVCVIGKTVCDELFDTQEEAIGALIRLDKIPFRVIGVLEEKGQTFGMDRDNLIIAPFQTVQKRMMGIDYANQILAATEDEAMVDQAKKEINEVMIERLEKVSGGEPQFNIRTQKEMMDIMGTITTTLTILLASIASISLLVGGIGIMNIMLVSVTERTREIGLRLAVGAPGKVILLQFLTEAVIISLIGGFIGVMLGYALANGAGAIMGIKAVITARSVLLAFGFASTVGVVFGFFPARKAARLHPIEALRHE